MGAVSSARSFTSRRRAALPSSRSARRSSSIPRESVSMADPARSAQRRPALAEPPRVRQGVSIKVLPAETRFSLRFPIGAAPSEVAGFRLNMAINRLEIEGARWCARLGPNEWLLAGPEAETDAIAQEIATALAGKIHGLTDISHRQVAVEVA